MKRDPLDLTGRPDKPWRVPSPDQLEFGDMFRIKGATGVDPLDPPTYAHGVAACLWFASRDWTRPLTWEECQRATLDDVDLEEGDVELDEEDREDPTHGSGTQSNVSSSPDTTGSDPATSDAAPPTN